MIEPCPRCGHDPALHSNAGSEPDDPTWSPRAWIVPGVMCCYAKPDDGDDGIPNHYTMVCGCSFTPDGATLEDVDSSRPIL